MSWFDLAEAPSTENPIDLAQKCDTSQCTLPYCFCSRDGTIIPGGLDPKEVCFFYHDKIIFWLCILKNVFRHPKWFCWHLTEHWIKIIMITIKKYFPIIRKILTDVSLKVHSSYHTNTVIIIWYKNSHTKAMRLVLKLCRKYI